MCNIYAFTYLEDPGIFSRIPPEKSGLLINYQLLGPLCRKKKIIGSQVGWVGVVAQHREIM